MPAAKPKTPRAKRATPKAADANVQLTKALAEASWSEADVALAEALSLCDELETAATLAKRKLARELLQQALGQAARKRGLTRLGEVGAKERYEPARHDFDAVRAPKMVRVVARGVARGKDVLVKVRAGPVKAAKKTVTAKRR